MKYIYKLLSNSIGQTLSNYQACVQLEEYLVARLGKSNHNIKYKTLIIIKVSIFKK